MLLNAALTRRSEGAALWSVRERAVETGISKTTQRHLALIGVQPHVEGITHDYVRHGMTTMFAILDVANGRVFTQRKAWHWHQGILGFLRHIEASVLQNLDVHLVIDNYGTHARVRVWCTRRPRFHVHHARTYVSWLNQVERWLGLIAQRAIRRGSPDSLPDIRPTINDFVAHYNHHPRPWTSIADSFLAKREWLAKSSGTQH